MVIHLFGAVSPTLMHREDTENTDIVRMEVDGWRINKTEEKTLKMKTALFIVNPFFCPHSNLNNS